jgi:glycosyltransferase involved in cell wall biosynthesis
MSVIICTYARAEALEDLLHCLLGQTFKDFEVLVVDGSGHDDSVHAAVSSFRSKHAGSIDLTLIQSAKGLTRQRNVGLRHAKGALICFFDDDVTFDSEFLADAAKLLSRPELQDVGGLTGYDVLNYASPITMRWHMRLLLGVVPSLDPGSIDRLGRAVPLGFLRPFLGLKSVGHFSGFCMIYRRTAVSNLWFDERLPTYGGEDRDFSHQVGLRSRLLICGDLHLQHHRAPVSRDHDVHRSYQEGFGTGRMFAKQANRSDYPLLLRVVVGEIIVSVMAFVRKPSRNRLFFIFARPFGVAAGFRSYYAERIGPSGCASASSEVRKSN